MQFQTILVAKTPRTNCSACGVRTLNLPWAEPQGRFTLLFEAWAVKVLQACANIERVRVLLDLSWKAVHEIVKRAVERGVSRRDLEGVKHVDNDFGSRGEIVSKQSGIATPEIGYASTKPEYRRPEER